MSADIPELTFTEPLNRFERFRDDLRYLKERWDNRIVLERCSLAKLYIDGRLEIVLYGDWPVGFDHCLWACRVCADRQIIDRPASGSEVECHYVYKGDDRNEVGVFRVVVQVGKGPKVFVRSVFGPYLFK